MGHTFRSQSVLASWVVHVSLVGSKYMCITPCMCVCVCPLGLSQKMGWVGGHMGGGNKSEFGAGCVRKKGGAETLGWGRGLNPGGRGSKTLVLPHITDTQTWDKLDRVEQFILHCFLGHNTCDLPESKDDIDDPAVNYGISNTIVLDIPGFTTEPSINTDQHPSPMILSLLVHSDNGVVVVSARCQANSGGWQL